MKSDWSGRFVMAACSYRKDGITMAIGQDMELRKPGMIDLGNGLVIMAGAAVRKTGLNPNDINFLVRQVAGGASWAHATRALSQTAGAIDASALAGWKKEIERRAGLYGKPNKVKDLTTMDLVLPSARNEREQCKHTTDDVPHDVARCILKVHAVGGHVPGKPRFHQADDEPVARPTPAPTRAKPRSGKLELATSPKSQCRTVCEEGDREGDRCLLVLHDGDEHVYEQPKAKPAPKKKAARRSTKAVVLKGGAGAGG